MFQPVLLGIGLWVSMRVASSYLSQSFQKTVSALASIEQWRSLIPGDCADMFQGDGRASWNDCWRPTKIFTAWAQGLSLVSA